MEAEIAIIGGGPAGMATAIQLKRYNLAPLLIEQDELGGLLRNANLVENYLGFPHGITGPNLVNLFKDHLKVYSVPILFEPVISLEFKETDNFFSLNTPSSKIRANVVVVATGTKAKLFKKTKTISSDVYDEIIYEVFPIRNVSQKKIVIVGSGDAAFDYAINLSNKNEVIIMCRQNSGKALPLLFDRAKASPNISVCYETHLKKAVKGKNKRFLISFEQLNKKLIKIETDYFIGAIGRVPRKDFFSHDLTRKAKNLISNGQLYLVGDIKNGSLRQTAMAVGNGVKAAMEIFLKR